MKLFILSVVTGLAGGMILLNCSIFNLDKKTLNDIDVNYYINIEDTVVIIQPHGKYPDTIRLDQLEEYIELDNL